MYLYYVYDWLFSIWGFDLLLPDSLSEPPLGPPVGVWVCHSQQRQKQHHSCPHLGKMDTQYL